MAIVLSILRRAHARGTHHFLALDALDHLDIEAKANWQRLFFKHIGHFVDGAKAPDTAFKDFENHVLHPRHGFWGGAIDQVETWYAETVAALTRQDWPAAAYAAGVLSHYVTDPLQPLHTHQTEAENAIHAAVEWSVSRTYDVLVEAVADDAAGAAIDGAMPIADLMRVGAQAATAHYETILAHYDIKRGVVAPEEGLDALGRRVIGGRLVAARQLFAHILSRAIRASGAAPAEVGLAADALKAFLTLPAARRARKKLDAADRQLVEAMYDELMATGRVEQTLPEDERKIRDLFAAYLAAEASAAAQPGPVAPPAPHEAMAPPPSSETADDLDPEDPPGAVPLERRRVAVDEARPAPPVVEAPRIRLRSAAPVGAAAAATTPALAVEASVDEAPAAIAPSPAETDPANAPLHVSPPPALGEIKPVQIEAPPSARVAPALATYRPAAAPTGRSTLSLDADVVDAPSIGPKTAKRLNAVGIDTVGDFLKAHPIALSARLEHEHMTAAVLTEWQDQTRLMVTLAGLRAADAKLLVGAGYRTIDAITNVEPDQFAADLLRFALTAEGRSLLREGHVPDAERLRDWAIEARAVKAA